MSEKRNGKGISKALFAGGLVIAVLVSTALSISVFFYMGLKSGSQLFFAHWHVDWRTITNGTWDPVVGSSTFPGVFFYNWSTGNVFGTYNDNIGFYTGTMEINIQRDGPFTFTVGSDSGAVLWIDGQMVLDDGGIHSYRTRSVTINSLPQGFHTLALDYKEIANLAVLSFNCDLDILVWQV